jgi:hypothetical protein
MGLDEVRLRGRGHEPGDRRPISFMLPRRFLGRPARRSFRGRLLRVGIPTAYDHGAASRVDRFWLQMIVSGCSHLQKSSARRVCRRLQFCKRGRRLPAAGCDHNIPTARVYRYPLRDRSPGCLEAIGSNGSHGGACWNVEPYIAKKVLERLAVAEVTANDLSHVDILDVRAVDRRDTCDVARNLRSPVEIPEDPVGSTESVYQASADYPPESTPPRRISRYRGSHQDRMIDNSFVSRRGECSQSVEDETRSKREADQRDWSLPRGVILQKSREVNARLFRAIRGDMPWVVDHTEG